MNPWWLRQPGRRLPLRWCIFSAFIAICVISWVLIREMEPKTAKSSFEACAYLITEAGVPPLEKLAGQKYAGTHETSSSEKQGARVISANELMELVESGEQLGPRILHQSWKDDELPEHFKRWSLAWQKQLGETWLYVLWKDEDNKKLVELHYPEYLEAYESLPKEIYRADMVRNMYMHHFGGAYADLDLIPLGTFPSQLPILQSPYPNPAAISYLGYMGDKSYEHSIPNAFMVSSTPGHPFWLRPLQFIKKHQHNSTYNNYPESLTGPVALRSCVLEWEKERELRAIAGELAEVTVLSSDKIYPFSWYDSPLVHQCLCRPHSPHFSEPRCQWLYPTAWTITYWTHSWGFW